MSNLTSRRARFGLAALISLGALGGAAAAGLAAHTAPRVSHITVTEREYRITLSQRSFKPGMTTFVVQNRGKVAHEFAIRGPGISSKRIAGMIAPGAQRSLSVRLRGGSYTLFCPLHLGLGMKTTIRVSGAGAGGAALTTTAATTTGGGGSWG